MKKVMAFFVLLCSVGVLAQDPDKVKLSIEKGTWNVGGNLSLAYTDEQSTSELNGDSNNRNRFSVNFLPNIGYAVRKNLMLGLSVGGTISNADTDRTVNGITESTFSSAFKSWSIVPYVRNFFPVGKKSALFVQGEVGYSRGVNSASNENTNDLIGESRVTSYFAGIRPGLVYFIGDNLALETRFGFLGYTSDKFDSERTENEWNSSGQNNNFSFNLSTAELFFGLSYYF